ATLLIRSTLPTEVPPYFWTISAIRSRGRDSQRAERECRVGAAEAEGVGQRGTDRHPARRIGHEVEIAARILLEQVRRRWRDLIAQRKHREHGFDCGCGAEKMSGHRLGGGHR